MSSKKRLRVDSASTILESPEESESDMEVLPETNQMLARSIMKNRKRDQDGNIVNWLLIKCLRYQKDLPGIIQYRYRYTDQYRCINIFNRGRPPILVLQKAFKSLIPICKAKKNDLVKLCTQGVIPNELHLWYKSLPTSNQAKDSVPEPAQTDSGEDDDESGSGNDTE
ncbi:hypothetical protein LOTGIDRAFT_168241 [Lottia gigantea]|uniref:Uncharacterized protein n=1 Tax=Lottia gigantea TaxID=225164 RepID=V3ZL27_LOTGI|nr:hypothetical protein LOTGIDRAFT_168241 [Lottia gigantea]ESO84982.1 hypothetical protein LOTGIDRAFT_168241 [Lottia gigantea]